MDFKHILQSVESSKEFKDFIKGNPHYYLVHVFTVNDSEHDNVWQIGYYSKDTDRIVVFEHDSNNPDVLIMHPPQEALKKEEYIQPLDRDKLAIPKDKASELSEKALKEYYPRELFSKAIFLLQNLPEFGQVWNVTVVTHAFSVINMKIDAADGSVLKHHKQNLMDWKNG